MSAPAPSVRPAALIVINPSGQRSRHEIESTPFLIGRQTGNHLVLRDTRVSRQHARIVAAEGIYFVEDNESRHGVWVNGEKIVRHELAHSDRIEFGVQDSYQLIFTHGEAELNRLLEQVATPASTASAPAPNLVKLRALVEVARALQNAVSSDEVLEAVVDAALAVTGTERGFLLLRQADGLELRVARDDRGRPLAETDLTVPRRLIRRALDHRRELLSMSFDPMAETGVRPDASVAGLNLRGVVCVPLVRVRTGNVTETMHASMNETVGLLYLDSRVDAADLSSGNRELLQTLALEASTILENARLLEQERAKQRMEEELKIAHSIQQGLLPRALPCEGWFRAAGSSVASHQVGGDYFDVYRINSECWSTVVADVSGKGVSSALLASLLQGAFLMAAEEIPQTGRTVTRINRLLHERTQGEKYATLFYCTLDARGSLRWTNAGHCPPILVRTGRPPEILEATGMPVGMLSFAAYEVRESHLAPGDKLVLYTDGCSEAENPEGEFFGPERILDAVTRHAGASCRQLHAALMAAVDQFTGGAVQNDDITVVVLEYQSK